MIFGAHVMAGSEAEKIVCYANGSRSGCVKGTAAVACQIDDYALLPALEKRLGLTHTSAQDSELVTP